MKFLKRWREIPSEAEFTVGVDDRLTENSAQEAAQALLLEDRRPDRSKTLYPGVMSLEGDWWTVHAANGTVYLSGEDGTVQVQFAPVDAFSLGTLLQEAARH